jgi:ferredoxin
MVTMTWHVNIDKTACMGTGMCAALAPELFQLEDVTAEPVASDIAPTELALDAADQCPTMAIIVTENGHEIGPRP